MLAIIYLVIAVANGIVSIIQFYHGNYSMGTLACVLFLYYVNRYYSHIEQKNRNK